MVYTVHLPENDNRKFSGSTPLRLLHALKRCWTECPSSERIIRDINKIEYALHEIINVRGVIVPGLGNRNGHRAAVKPSVTNHGGARMRSDDPAVDAEWTHEDAREVKKEWLASLQVSYDAYKLNLTTEDIAAEIDEVVQVESLDLELLDTTPDEDDLNTVPTLILPVT